MSMNTIVKKIFLSRLARQHFSTAKRSTGGQTASLWRSLTLFLRKMLMGRVQQYGFTLIEMMITMGLLSIFLIVLATLFTASIDVQTRSRTYSAVTNDSRFLLARLDYDITRASAVTTPAALGASASSLVL